MSFDSTQPPAPPQGPAFPPAADTYAPAAPVPAAAEGQKSFIATWLLSYLVGFLGADRFYLGKFGTGLLKLVTLGGIGIWWLVDLVVVLAGGTRDKQGLALAGYRQHRKTAWIVTGALLVLGLIINAVNGANGASGSRAPSSDTQVSSSEAAAPSAEVATQTAAPVEDVQVEVPDVVGRPVSEARAALEAAGLVLVTSGDVQDDATVETQAPAGGESVEDGAEVTVTAKAPEPQLTLSQQNAVGSAENYLSFTAFSRNGLIAQLEYEGFSTEDASFAVDFVGADWNAEAAESAETYLEMMSFSRQGLYDQLAYEEYSPEQIEFALNAVGY